MFEVPNAELFYLTQKNTLKRKSVHDELRGKKVVVYFVCGAYTPTCSTKHVPEYESLLMMKSNPWVLMKFIVVL